MRRPLAVMGIAAVLMAGVASAAIGAFHRYSIPGYGIDVALPSSWRTINYREILKTGVLQTLARENPELAGYFAAMAQPNSPIKFFAYDPQVANGFATNANVVVAPLRTQLTFPDWERSLVDEIRTVSSVSDLHSSTVRLPGGRAVRVSYRLTITLPGRRLSVRTLQYGFLRGRRSVVFTYTTVPASARFYSSVFASSARSIRFS